MKAHEQVRGLLLCSFGPYFFGLAAGFGRGSAGGGEKFAEMGGRVVVAEVHVGRSYFIEVLSVFRISNNGLFSSTYLMGILSCITYIHGHHPSTHRQLNHCWSDICHGRSRFQSDLRYS